MLTSAVVLVAAVVFWYVDVPYQSRLTSYTAKPFVFGCPPSLGGAINLSRKSHDFMNSIFVIRWQKRPSAQDERWWELDGASLHCRDKQGCEFSSSYCTGKVDDAPPLAMPVALTSTTGSYNFCLATPNSRSSHGWKDVAILSRKNRILKYSPNSNGKCIGLFVFTRISVFIVRHNESIRFFLWVIFLCKITQICQVHWMTISWLSRCQKYTRAVQKLLTPPWYFRHWAKQKILLMIEEREKTEDWNATKKAVVDQLGLRTKPGAVEDWKMV